MMEKEKEDKDENKFRALAESNDKLKAGYSEDELILFDKELQQKLNKSLVLNQKLLLVIKASPDAEQILKDTLNDEQLII